MVWARVDLGQPESHSCPYALRAWGSKAGPGNIRTKRALRMIRGFVADLSTGDGFVAVSLSGELDLAEAPVLRKTLDRVLRPGTSLIVIDAHALQFIDSTGIGVLVAAHNHLEATGGLLVIA